MATVEQLEALLNQIYQDTQTLLNRLVINASQIRVEELSAITANLGLAVAGEFRSGTGETKDLSFKGVRIGSPGWEYNGTRYAITGWNGSTFNFGLSAEDGTITAAGSMQSTNYVPGTTGWQIDAGGTAEFQNVLVRGTIESSILKYQEIQAVGGNVFLTKAAFQLYEDEQIGPATGTILLRDDGQALAVGDALRIKTENKDAWLTVDSITDSGDYLTVGYTRAYGDIVLVLAGAAVVNYGAAPSGVIDLKAPGPTGPHIDMGFAGAEPWTSINRMMRMGNLAGSYGYTNPSYDVGVFDISLFDRAVLGDAILGVAMGEYAVSKPNITIDPVNGMRFRLYQTNVMQFLDGNADITGLLRMPGTSSAISIGATPPTSSSVGTGLWLDRTGLYGLSSSTEQIKIDSSTGQLIAGDGLVVLDASGLRLNIQTDISYDEKSSLEFYSEGILEAYLTSYRFTDTGGGTITSLVTNEASAGTGGTATTMIVSESSQISLVQLRTNYMGGFPPTSALLSVLSSAAGDRVEIIGYLKVSGAFGCNNKTAQTAYASGGAVNASTVDTTYGAEERDVITSLRTIVGNIRTALINNGIMS